MDIKETDLKLYFLLFGGIVSIIIFIFLKLEQILKTVIDHVSSKYKIIILEYVAEAEKPVSLDDIYNNTDIKFGICRKKSNSRIKALCYKMILDGTLTYKYEKISNGDLPPQKYVGYKIKS